ncbi:HNH endonuclease [Aeromonas hydrophila]|uniref:HNH endonuclease n=1 Tax=Aeromonas hydrophila TaxID=644 RepID=UPI002B4BA561|nr:HNH endonuclease [Aeromonas hydrophila]WRK93457.1 HNH endonuclease [Aeromonas hydrophila]
MAFWWVNHKQTYSAEVGGGYIWSPKTNRNGSKNQTYINLTLTRPRDVVISYAGGLIKAIGLVATPCSEKSKPSEFGSAGDSWSDTGWEVRIDWELLEKPIRPKEHMELIAPLLPIKNSPLRASGDGNQSCYLAGISNELGDLLLSLAPDVQLRAATPSRARNVHVFDNKEEVYLAWVEENQSGFVANMDKAKSMKQYPMIHSASDPQISKDKHGNFTTNAYFKICSTDLRELKSYLKHKYHRFTYCRKCFDTLEEWQEYDEAAVIEEIQHSTLPETEKEQLVKSRRGQGLFRSRLEKIEQVCRVTGVSNKALLIASHIRPWRESNNVERLDGHNGLLLSPHIDKLFDRGWITFTDSGDLLCAEPSIEQALQQWGIELPLNVGRFEPKQAVYLAYHRDVIFRADPVICV